MYGPISIVSKISNSSIIIVKNLNWDTAEFSKHVDHSYVLISSGSEIPKKPVKKIILDKFEEFRCTEKKRLEKVIYNAEQVIYLKNPFDEEVFIEPLLEISFKEVYLFNLIKNDLKNRYKFFKLGFLSPRFRRFAYLFVSSFGQNKIHWVWIHQKRVKSSVIFQVLALGAKSKQPCYILGMNRPKGY